MSYSVYPQASGSVDLSSVAKTGQYVVVPSSTSGKYVPSSLVAGTYTVACVSSTVATVTFYGSSGSQIAKVSTTAGTVSVTLSEQATRMLVSIDTGTNITVTTTLVAAAVSSLSPNPTIITNSGNVEPGTYFAIIVGGGGGSGGAVFGNTQGGGGGGSGGIASGLFVLNQTTPLVIGAPGTGGTYGETNANAGNAGGTTTFANLTANGGGGGGGGYNISYNQRPGNGAGGGTPSGSGGATGGAGGVPSANATNALPAIFGGTYTYGVGGAGAPWSNGAGGTSGALYLYSV